MSMIYVSAISFDDPCGTFLISLFFEEANTFNGCVMPNKFKQRIAKFPQIIDHNSTIDPPGCNNLSILIETNRSELFFST